MQYNLFISHSKEDKEKYVFPLQLQLEDLGFTVWTDRDQISTGAEIYVTIKNALSCTSGVIVIIGKNFLKKSWPIREVKIALEQGCRLFIAVHEVDFAEIINVIPELRDRARESISTCSLDDSLRDSTFIDRLIGWYFNVPPDLQQSDSAFIQKLSVHSSDHHIAQLIALFNSANHDFDRLRMTLINKTNIIRYMCAIIQTYYPPEVVVQKIEIARKYCDIVDNKCFCFDSALSYDMLFSCKHIISALSIDLLALLDDGSQNA